MQSLLCTAKRIVASFVILMSWSHIAVAADWYVSLMGDNTSGTGWMSGLHSIQEAVNRAADGDTVWIDEGTYLDQGDGPFGSITVAGKSLAIYGRYNSDINPVKDPMGRQFRTVVPMGFNLNGDTNQWFKIKGLDLEAQGPMLGIVHGNFAGVQKVEIANCVFVGSGDPTLSVLFTTAGMRLGSCVFTDNVVTGSSTNASISINDFDNVVMAGNSIQTTVPGVGNPLVYINFCRDVIQANNTFRGYQQSFLGCYFDHCEGTVFSAYNKFEELEAAYGFGGMPPLGTNFDFCIEKNDIDNCGYGLKLPSYFILDQMSQKFKLYENNLRSVGMFAIETGPIEDYMQVDVNNNFFLGTPLPPFFVGSSVAMTYEVHRDRVEDFFESEQAGSLIGVGQGAALADALRNAERGIVEHPVDPFATTPLHQATSYQVVVELLMAGADVHAVDMYGNTALHYARDKRIIEVLLQYGANANAANLVGETPLYFSESSLEVDCLVDGGANVHHLNFHGQTPLHRASNGRVVAALLGRGASALAKDVYQRGPLHYAKDRGSVKDLVAAGAEVHLMDWLGRTALHCRCDNVQVVIELLNAGAYANVQDDEGQTPLHFVSNGHSVQKLIQHGAAVGIQDREGRSPLHLARSGHVAEQLLQAGSVLDLRDYGYKTPLHYAANGSVAEVLVRWGADVNAIDYDGFKPMHYARDQQVVRVLVGAGASPNGQ